MNPEPRKDGANKWLQLHHDVKFKMDDTFNRDKESSDPDTPVFTFSVGDKFYVRLQTFVSEDRGQSNKWLKGHATKPFTMLDISLFAHIVETKKAKAIKWSSRDRGST